MISRLFLQVLPSSAPISASAGLRWSLISILPHPHPPPPPGKVWKWPKTAKLTKAELIHIIRRLPKAIYIDEFHHSDKFSSAIYNIIFTSLMKIPFILFKIFLCINEIQQIAILINVTDDHNWESLWKWWIFIQVMNDKLLSNW